MTAQDKYAYGKTFLHILGLVYSPEPDYEEIAAVISTDVAKDVIRLLEAYKRNVRQYGKQDFDHSSGTCSARL